jgi:hypothetical protein
MTFGIYLAIASVVWLYYAYKSRLAGLDLSDVPEEDRDATKVLFVFMLALISLAWPVSVPITLACKFIFPRRSK